MTRQILGLKHDAYSYILDRIPKAITSETIYNDKDIADIVLSDNVIIKVYDDGILLDLGMKKVELEADDFRMLTVR